MRKVRKYALPQFKVQLKLSSYALLRREPFSLPNRKGSAIEFIEEGRGREIGKSRQKLKEISLDKS